MNREEVINIAKKAGDDVEHTLPSDLDFLERFANLVAKQANDDYSNKHANLWLKRIDDAVKAEREACAQVCEDWDSDSADPRDVASAIRARGEK
jgi:thiaminase